MSNFRKRVIALASVICVALTSFASCAEPNDKNKESSNPTSSADGNVSDGNGSNDGNESKDGNGSNDGNESKDGNGSNDGNESKDGNGSEGANNSAKPTLEHVDNDAGHTVITPFQSGSPADLAAAGITLPGGNEKVDLDADDPTSKNDDGSGYVSKTDSRYCLWIDISKDKNYVFNGDFIDVYFKIKDNIPEKDYAVRFKTDFSTIEGNSITPDKIIQGNIRVGGSIDAQDVSKETGFVAYGDNVSAKSGDEVCYRINLKNNPGLAAILVWIYFDSNAMEVEDVIPAGEFAKIARTSTSTGSKPQS
ncbi:MAG: hypothetical protein K6G33_13020 [Ruminococcus sp.]|uniref:hypothetical protein n=1 Tax=Ruminococcus sp. TaxID=41978 RepID=UPI0025D1A9C9|nr:hypothetical protein [Ruminococcus sp.]MCR5601652.1 hypothetical protein [Ruminococcus sp.]